MSEYYVFNTKDVKKGWMDGCMVWWRPKGNGYTYDLNHAGIYTDEDRAKGYPPENEECVWVPKELVDENTYSPKLAWWVKSGYPSLKAIMLQAFIERFNNIDMSVGTWHCSSCGKVLTNLTDGEWRWNGIAWEHSHGQAGHFEGRKEA